MGAKIQLSLACRSSWGSGETLSRSGAEEKMFGRFKCLTGACGEGIFVVKADMVISEVAMTRASCVNVSNQSAWKRNFWGWKFEVVDS